MGWIDAPLGVLLLCTIASSQLSADWTDCEGTEFIGTYKMSDTKQVTFSIQGASSALMRTINENGIPPVVSQMETCAVKKDNPGEIFIAFKHVEGQSMRFCWKGILVGKTLFQVEGPAASRPNLDTATCISDLSASAAYNMMILEPVPNSASSFGVDIGDLIKAGTYKATWHLDNQSPKCSSEDKAVSNIVVDANSFTFYVCDVPTSAPSYVFPFGIKLYVAGYVIDEKLMTVASNSHTGGAFVVVTNNQAGADNSVTPFTYYIFRVFERVLSDDTKDTYFEFNFMTIFDDRYEPIGYVDGNYVPQAQAQNYIVSRMYSEECLSLPCQNDGICVNRWLNYTCRCPNGFDGDTCADKATECAKNPTPGSLCNMRGRCEDVAGGSYKCNCNDGWTGAFCDEQTYCLPGICKNGGDCIDLDDQGFALCECKPGWSGTDCSQKTASTCRDNQPCKNGGECYDVPGGDHFCECVDPWVGKNCDGATPGGPGGAICIPGQTDDVCLNGGQCVDKKCECMGNYVGMYCEDVNRWFIASVVLMVIVAGILITTIIVCFFFCAKGRALSSSYPEPSKPYDPFVSPFPQSAPSNAGFQPVGYVQPQPTFTPEGGVFIQAY